MYPTLYHAFHDLLGLDLSVLKLLNTFGFFVALAFFAAARTLASELDRKHELGQLPSVRRPYEPPRPMTKGDLALSGVFAFIIGYKVFGVWLSEQTLQGGSDIQQYLLSSRGHVGAGIATGLLWLGVRYREYRNSLYEPEPEEVPEFVEITPREHTVGFTGAAALGGIIGA